MDVIDMDKSTNYNVYYRNVILTTENMQIVLMSIKPNEEIGMEVHPNTTQFIKVEGGKGLAITINNDEQVVYEIKEGSSVTITQGTYHNIVNTSNDDLKIYSIYSPPEHEVSLGYQVNKGDDFIIY